MRLPEAFVMFAQVDGHNAFDGGVINLAAQGSLGAILFNGFFVGHIHPPGAAAQKESTQGENAQGVCVFHARFVLVVSGPKQGIFYQFNEAQGYK